MIGLIAMFILLCLGLIVLNTSIPYWIRDNSDLMIITYALFMVGFSVGFVKFGLK